MAEFVGEIGNTKTDCHDPHPRFRLPAAELMQNVLELLNKINQLDAPQRRDIATLLEILPQPPRRPARLVRMLSRQLNAEYVQGWAEATGGQKNEFGTFLRGAVNRLFLPRASLVNLHSSNDLLVFTALFHEELSLDHFVRPDVMETFYVMHGFVELTLRLRRDFLRFHMTDGEANQVYPGKPYQLFASGGTRMVVVHSVLRQDADWGIYLGTRELTGSGHRGRVIRRRANEARGSETA